MRQSRGTVTFREGFETSFSDSERKTRYPAMPGDSCESQDRGSLHKPWGIFTKTEGSGKLFQSSGNLSRRPKAEVHAKKGWQVRTVGGRKGSVQGRIRVHEPNVIGVGQCAWEGAKNNSSREELSGGARPYAVKQEGEAVHLRTGAPA